MSYAMTLKIETTSGFL